MNALDTLKDLLEDPHNTGDGLNLSDEGLRRLYGAVAAEVKELEAMTLKAESNAKALCETLDKHNLTSEVERLKIHSLKVDSDNWRKAAECEHADKLLLVNQLSQLQQDVKPLLTELANHSKGGSETLEAFLSKHPELKETK